MILELEEEEHEREISEQFSIKESEGTDIKVYEKGIVGQTDYPWLWAKFNQNGEYIVSCYSNGQIELYNADKLGYICNLEDSEEETKKAVCTMVKFKPSDVTESVVAVDVKGEIRRYSILDQKQTESIKTEEGENNRLFALDYSSDGLTFATGGTDHFVRIYDDATMKLKGVMDPFYTGKSGHDNRIFWVKYNTQDPNLLCSSGWDSTIIVHDIRKKGPVLGMLGAYVCGDALDFNGKDIISGSYRLENQLEVYDTRKIDKSQDISWDGTRFDTEAPTRIFCLARTHLDSINNVLIAGGWDSNELHIFNNSFESVVRLTDISRSIFTCDISHNSQDFLFAGGDGVIRVWKMIIYN